MADGHAGKVSWTAGAARPLDVLRRRFRYPGTEELGADVAAIERGEVRKTVVITRGSFAPFPRRFRPGTAFLMPNRLVIGPSWHSLARRSFAVTWPVRAAGIRQRNPKTDWNLLATGEYGPGGRLAYRGAVVIRCDAGPGFFELAVFRPDAELVLRYIKKLHPDAQTTAHQ